MNDTVNQATADALSRWSLVIHVCMASTQLVVNFALWVSSRREVIKTWAGARAADTIALCAVFIPIGDQRPLGSPDWSPLPARGRRRSASHLLCGGRRFPLRWRRVPRRRPLLNTTGDEQPPSVVVIYRTNPATASSAASRKALETPPTPNFTPPNTRETIRPPSRSW